MKKIILLIAIILGFGNMFAQVLPSEKDALIALYESTQGENWVHSWDLNTNVDTWHGVTVKENGVVAVSLLFNNLVGTLPQSIGNLPNLQKLELSFNKISGTIPASIGNLKNLRIFEMNGNSLEGEIPTALGELVHLEQLHLSSNQLVGRIPTTLGSLDNLKILNVFDNKLVGTIPSSLVNNDALEELVISKNNIERSKAFTQVLLFKEAIEDPLFNNLKIVIPTKTVIATETSEDTN